MAGKGRDFFPHLKEPGDRYAFLARNPGPQCRHGRHHVGQRARRKHECCHRDQVLEGREWFVKSFVH